MNPAGYSFSLCASPNCCHCFAGSTNGAVKMWGYGEELFKFPSLLRQLRKKASGSQGGALPHAKVVRLALSSSGRVLWTAGKETISLWVARSEWLWEVAACMG